MSGSGEFTGRCMRCRENKKMLPEEGDKLSVETKENNKRQVRILAGKCETCGAKMRKFIGKDVQV